MYPIWRGKPVIPSYSATRELLVIGINLEKAVDILENGYDDIKTKRKKGTIEKCSTLKGKYIKVVAVETYQYSSNMEIWLITHVGD
jgi:hypothetical protein